MRRFLGMTWLSFVVLILPACGSSVRPKVPGPRGADPAVLVDVAYTFQDRLDVRSSTTGQTIRSLGYFGSDLGGATIAPDGQTTYLQFISPKFGIVGVRTRDAKRTFRAPGYAPTISPDSRLVAYLDANNDRIVRVQNVATRATRSIDLGSRVDASGDLFNGQKVWLTGSSTLAVIPTTATTKLLASSGSASVPRRRSHGCGSRSGAACVLLIPVPQAGPLRYVRRVVVSNFAVSNVTTIASDAKDQLIIASNDGGTTARVDVLALAHSPRA